LQSFLLQFAAVGGNAAAGKLLVLSQVILSFILIFAVVPLVHFTSSRAKMGSFVNLWLTRIAATIIAILIAGLNAYLIVQAYGSGHLGLLVMFDSPLDYICRSENSYVANAFFSFLVF
jgi:Mn2+/Fe2+ NRAMP family transporter